MLAQINAKSNFNSKGWGREVSGGERGLGWGGGQGEILWASDFAILRFGPMLLIY